MKESDPPKRSIPPHPALTEGRVRLTGFSVMIFDRFLTEPPAMTPRLCVSYTPGSETLVMSPNIRFISSPMPASAHRGSAMVRAAASAAFPRRGSALILFPRLSAVCLISLSLRLSCRSLRRLLPSDHLPSFPRP